MIYKKTGSILSILGESPFFAELSIKEREDILKELYGAYPNLFTELSGDIELGYEVGWPIG